MKYTVLVSLIPNVKERLEKFAKKFNKYGEGTFSYNIGEPYAEKYGDVNCQQCYRNVADIEIEGFYKVGNYEFVASLEYIPEAGKNLIKKAPNADEVPEMYLTRTACDHCKTDRFRKYTIILKNTDTNELIQVGKSCVKDYIGVDAGRYISYLACFESLEDYIATLGRERVSKADVAFSIDSILEQTVACKNDRGYISKAMVAKWYDEHEDDEMGCPFTTTASTVYHIMNHTRYDGKLVEEEYVVTDEIRAEVEEIKKFIDNDEETSNYATNLKTLLKAEAVDNDKLGLAVSIVGYYIRKTAEKKERAERVKSEFVGEIGDKITIMAIPECVTTVDTMYGLMRVYRFVVGNDILIWKTSKYLNADTPVTIKATVKAHDTYKGIRQTEITRARVA